MGHYMRGAPMQYVSGGQSHAAKQKAFRESGTPERNIMNMLHKHPEQLRKKMLRLSWPDVLQKIKETRKDVYLHLYADANTRAIEKEDIEYFPALFSFQAALALYECKAPRQSVRALVERAWISHSGVFKAFAGNDLYPMLRHGQFKPPASLGPEFSIWRGTRGVPLEVARAGKSWTTDPRVACVWIDQINRALANGGGRIIGAPLIIHRKVRAEDVVFWTNEQGMHEIVLDEHVQPAGEQDGEANEWKEVAAEHRETLSGKQAWERAVSGGASTW